MEATQLLFIVKTNVFVLLFIITTDVSILLFIIKINDFIINNSCVGFVTFNGC